MPKNKSLSLSSDEEAFILALRALLGSSASAGPDEEVPDDVDDEVDEVEEDDEDGEEEELEALDREETESLGIKDLRTLAKQYLGDDAPTKKADILAAFDENDLYDEEAEDEDDEDVEEVEEDDEAEDEGSYDRDELEELDLKELRKIAKAEGHAQSEIKGLDQDDLVDLIMGEEADEDDEDEEEDDDETEEITEDDLKAMSHKELMSLAKEIEVKVPAALKKSSTANQKKLVKLILDSGDDE